MSKKLVLTTLAVAMFSASAMAEKVNDHLNVYGKLNVSYGVSDKDTGDTDKDYSKVEMKSNSSRLGVKGAYKVDHDLEAVYKYEWEIDVSDEGKSSNDHIKSRNQYVGLKGSFGQVVVGRHDTPLKASQGKVDQFGDLEGDLKHIMKGDNRVDNVLYYKSPKFSGVQLHTALVPGETSEAEGGEDQDGIMDSMSTAISYEQKGIYAAIAYDDNVKGYDTTRLTTTYKTEAFQAGFLYQIADQASNKEDSKITSWLLSGHYKVGKIKLKAQFGATDYDNKKNQDADLFAIGADYKLGKKTTGYAFYSNVTDKEEVESAALKVGLVQKF